jgi:hypothetical protein
VRVPRCSYSTMLFVGVWVPMVSVRPAILVIVMASTASHSITTPPVVVEVAVKTTNTGGRVERRGLAERQAFVIDQMCCDGAESEAVEFAAGQFRAGAFHRAVRDGQRFLASWTPLRKVGEDSVPEIAGRCLHGAHRHDRQRRGGRKALVPGSPA